MTNFVAPDVRILVGAGSYVDAVAAVRIVERLAETLNTELGGVLVEENTLELCRLPNQRVVQSSGETTHAPNRAQVRTLMQADARAFRQLLAKAAHPSRPFGFFTQERGDLVPTALQTAAGWDLLIIGHRRVHKMRGKIVVLGSQGPDETAMDTMAVRLSDKLRTQKIQFAIQTARVSEAAGVIQLKTLGETLGALSRLNAEAVLLDLRTGIVQDQTDLARVVEAARCPVIVFGVAPNQARLTHSIHIPPVSTGIV